MRQVYARQVAIATQARCAYVAGIPDTELAALPPATVRPGRTVSVARDVFDDLTRMMRDARTALAGAKRAGVPHAQAVTDVRVLSGYRSAREQLSIWEREYAKYYRDTRASRRDLPGGEHGSDAVDYLARYINLRVFSPGYSPHQRGRTVDLTYQEGNRWSAADTSPATIDMWRSSWFFAWLRVHAPEYGFAQNLTINEPWHWEFSTQAQQKA